MAALPPPGPIEGAPPLAVIETTFGPYITGMCLQFIGQGVFTVQLYDYYRMFQKDPGYIKWLVVVLAIATTLQTTIDFVNVYRCAVTNYGNFAYFDIQDWSLWSEIVMSAIIGTIAQVFFLGRCWSATKSKIIVGVFGIAIAGSLGGGIASTAEFQRIVQLSKVPDIPIPIIFWLVITAVIDVAIAVVLVVSLLRMKTPFRKTEAIITKMIRVTMETSSLTAAIAVLNLVLYLGLPGKAYHLLPQLSMGKLYAISVMVTLSSRKELRDIIEQADYASFMTSQQGHPMGTAGSTVKAGSPPDTRIKVQTTTTLGDPNADLEIQKVGYTNSDDDVHRYDRKGNL